MNISDSALNITGKQQTGKDHENSQKVIFLIIDAGKTKN